MNDELARYDRARALGLALTDGVGWKILNRLLDYFGSLEAIFGADQPRLQKVRGIGREIATRVAGIDLERMIAATRSFEAQGIAAVLWFDADYPAPFRQMNDRPLVLFRRGSLLPADVQAVAIVGTRQPTPESAQLAAQWAATFAEHGWTVVSGLARGVDTQAHRGALDAGGRSLAVLGCGLNTIYPPENAALAQMLVERGAVLSEIHPDSPTVREALMRRNRLITALSKGVIIIEAGVTSGALHAARFAHAQGRPVFALHNSAGNAVLLKEYALLLPDNPDQGEQVISHLLNERDAQ
jgi:DNA processing protein